MSKFLQLHLLTFYPPSNLNRDDTGRPKTATVGGVPRLRISSQSLKRAWRTAWRKSETFSEIRRYLGDRTQRIGRDVANLARSDFGLTELEANAAGLLAASVFGKLDAAPKPGQELFTKQLAFIGRDERAKLRALLDRIASQANLKNKLVQVAGEFALDAEEEEPDNTGSSKKTKQSKATTKLITDIRDEILTIADTSLDIAMFGRMLADSPKFNREAAVQVAHAITTHRVVVEDDYYTAIDDLKRPEEEEDAGAGFVGELGFGSGIFYLYACIDADLLIKNLRGEKKLAADACAALAEAAATVSPKGKQPSFAARARAHYILAEAGKVQPRTLAGAFVKPVQDDDLAKASVLRLEDWRAKLDRAYGPAAEETKVMDVSAGRGTLAEIVAFCRDAAGHD
jgi:CRISPR system Cascade subunit CasC